MEQHLETDKKVNLIVIEMRYLLVGWENKNDTETKIEMYDIILFYFILICTGK